MKKLLSMVSVVVLMFVSSFAFAGETGTFLSRRLANSATVTPGKWHRNFSKAKAWAVEQGVPFIAVWSNGDSCGHCVQFEKCLNNATFKNWEKSSGVVFWFGYSGDSEYPIGGSVFNWVRANTNVNYPFVRIYWPKGKVDIATIGDLADGYSSGKATAGTLVNFFKGKIKGFVPFDKNQPYSIKFNANLPSDYKYVAGDRTDDVSLKVVYSDVVKATNVFTTAEYTLLGWSAAAGTAATKYAVGASLQGLTTVSNAIVNLYGQWAHANYKVEFDPNYDVDLPFVEENVTNMPSVVFAYNVTTNLPANVLTRKDYTFSGWALTPTGAVKYKDKAAVKNLTRNASVRLYAVWVRTTYRTYYTGKKYTITALSSFKGRTISGKIPGMAWSSAYGRFTGTPTTPGTYKIGFVKKGSTTAYRYFVVARDAIDIPDASDRRLKTDTSTVSELSVVSVSGTHTGVTVTGLPVGMTYDPQFGKITGRPRETGTFTVKVTAKNSWGQTLSSTYTFEVAEGDTLLISGLAHFDEFWAECDETVSLPLRLRVCTNGVFEVLKPTEEVTVKLLRPDGDSWSPAGPEFGKLEYDDETATLSGYITGECLMQPIDFDEFKVEISTSFEDDLGESRYIDLTYPLKVYVSPIE